VTGNTAKSLSVEIDEDDGSTETTVISLSRR